MAAPAHTAAPCLREINATTAECDDHVQENILNWPLYVETYSYYEGYIGNCYFAV